MSLRYETLETLELRAADERRRLDRFMRHVHRCVLHAQRVEHVRGVNLSHDAYEFFGDFDYLDDKHVWTMRLLRRARRARQRDVASEDNRA